jgi:hypothetical protein
MKIKRNSKTEYPNSERRLNLETPEYDTEMLSRKS